ncbi:MAG TPA: AMP-binding protein [Burkholderiales bacterium]|nr:AMP-binding protein [Burkholderiales bacterium]
MRLEQLLFSHAERTPERVAVVSGDTRLSYAELAQSVKRTASSLNVNPGERVAIRLPNGIEFVQAFYAALAAGASVVPVNARLALPEVEHILEDAKPAWVFTAEGFPAGSEKPLQEQTNDECVVLYTSGTTGRPKGAINTHANVIVQNVYQHAIAWGIGSRDVYLATTPLAHRAGVARLANALGLGGTLVAAPKFDAAAALESIERERVTVAGLPPTVLRMMLPEIRRDPSKCASLRTVIVSAEAFPLSLFQEVNSVLPRVRFHAVYGMSEAAISSATDQEMRNRPGTAGRPFPGIEVKIEDDELLVRGAFAVMKGYLGHAPVAGGWFRTGDLVRRDRDGYLFVVDRRKDMVVSGGYKVYAKELEQVLVQHPAIEDAAVLGVPDAVYGEAVVAVVQPKAGQKLSEEDVVAHCRSQLAGYKKPRHVIFVEALPRNSLGKVVKRELRIRIEAAPWPGR